MLRHCESVVGFEARDWRCDNSASDVDGAAEVARQRSWMSTTTLFLLTIDVELEEL